MKSRDSTRLHRSFRAGAASWLVRNVVLPIWARRDHPAHARYLRAFQQTQFLDREALEKLQWERLQKLLRHAYDNCPFYRQRMEHAGLPPSKIRSIEKLRELPLLSKRDIQDHGAELQAGNFPPSARVRNQTGGSTGSPLQFYVDRERLDSRMASTDRHNQWAGVLPGDWTAELWGARLDQLPQQSWWDRCRNTLLYRTVSLNTSSLREEDWVLFVKELRRKRPRAIVTYTQSAVLFARYLRQAGIEDIRFDAIITTAEVLLPGQREFLEETLGGKVFNRYGCREVSIIASECEQHRGMHVNAEALLVEIVADPSFSGPGGRIVITDLLNYSMPLIRYSIGDVGSWAADQNCPCGRGLSLLADVQGRATDFLVLPDGRLVSGPALTLVVADMPDVRQVQFVQKARNRVVLRVVPGRNYGTSTAQELHRRMRLYLGAQTLLEVELAENIASELSGKYRFVINELGNWPNHEGMVAREETNLERH